MTDLTTLSALDLSDGLARRDFSALDLMEATLARIEAVNPALNAIVSLRDADELRSAARAADNAERAGWLHGIPIAIKDLANAQGLPTTMGSPLFKDTIAPSDDIMVARLKAAGAIVIGKTNSPEFGLGSHTFNPVFGTTKNPYNPDLTCGGSSGGAAVALAAGMLAVADGSDMMGSLRNPAAWNNVYGHRPSWGLVPTEPRADTFMHQLATNGPMARSPRDLAALLHVMAGPDPRQPHGTTPDATLAALRPTADTLRIGWLGDWGGAFAFEAGILDLCQAALTQMQTLGHQIDDLPPPHPREAIWSSWVTLRHWSVASGLAELYRNDATRDRLKQSAQWEISNGLALSAEDIQSASAARSAYFTRMAALFETYDVVCLPTAQVWPFPVSTEYPTEIAGQEMDTYHRWMEVMIPVSLIGLPAISVPVGFGGPNDMPMGMQLIGKRGSDAMLLALAQQWHEATHWPGARPPLLG
ncbi:MAG: amidase [Rhodobacteraceae bacterium]|nr:amidase [Paracoccaceae bacterium]